MATLKLPARTGHHDLDSLIELVFAVGMTTGEAGDDDEAFAEITAAAERIRARLPECVAAHDKRRALARLPNWLLERAT
jgi:hypothetical protein